MWTQIMRHSDPFMKLRQSKFRRSFNLDGYDKKLIQDLGMERIKEHAYAVVNKNLQNPKEDGKQTPYRGHPVFKAQHATATCCRKCLFRWHRIPRCRKLEEQETAFVVDIIMRWIISKY